MNPYIYIHISHRWQILEVTTWQINVTLDTSGRFLHTKKTSDKVVILLALLREVCNSLIYRVEFNVPWWPALVPSSFISGQRVGKNLFQTSPGRFFLPSLSVSQKTQINLKATCTRRYHFTLRGRPRFCLWNMKLHHRIHTWGPF